MTKFGMKSLAAMSLALGLVLTGCAGGSDDSSMPGMDHGNSSPSASSTADDAGAANEADVMFASMMIAHHEQAIEMSDMVLSKSGVDEQVTALAQQIKDAQGPEIEQMQSWLEDWGAEPSDTSEMQHGDGMMSMDDMTALQDADGAEASRLFLEQMIAHHEGAISMAETEVADGQNADAVALAQNIVDAQTAEIATMQELLGAI